MQIHLCAWVFLRYGFVGHKASAAEMLLLWTFFRQKAFLSEQNRNAEESFPVFFFLWWLPPLSSQPGDAVYIFSPYFSQFQEEGNCCERQIQTRLRKDTQNRNCHFRWTSVFQNREKVFWQANLSFHPQFIWNNNLMQTLKTHFGQNCVFTRSSAGMGKLFDFGGSKSFKTWQNGQTRTRCVECFCNPTRKRKK